MRIVKHISLCIFIFVSCSTSPNLPDVDKFLDDWHKNAADAEFNEYFSKLADDAIFLGTQWDERWTKKEFATFAMPYFDRGKAWTFEPFEREYYISDDQKIIWFEESLKTWMGICRGSGVLRNYGDSLKIVHYNLDRKSVV